MFLLSLSVAEGLYYWTFSTPAYSLEELSIGWRQIIRAANDHPIVLKAQSKIEKLSAGQLFQTPALSESVPLSEIRSDNSEVELPAPSESVPISEIRSDNSGEAELPALSESVPISEIRSDNSGEAEL